MIRLTKLNGKEVYINPHLIEEMEGTVEVRLHFISGKVLVIKDTQEDVINKIIQYRRSLGINSQDL